MSPQAAEPESVRDTDRGRLARDIQDAVAQLQAVRVERIRLERAQQDQVGALAEQVRRLSDEVEALEGEVQSREAAHRRLQAELEPVRSDGAAARRALESAAAATRSLGRHMRERIAAGIAWRRDDRLAQLDARLAALDAANPSGAVEAWLDFAMTELRLGRTIEHLREPVLYAGGERRVHARLARIGLVSAFFAAEDESVAGFSGRGAGQAWEMGGAERYAVALDVMERKRVPSWTTVPIPLGPIHSDDALPADRVARKTDGTEQRP